MRRGMDERGVLTKGQGPRVTAKLGLYLAVDRDLTRASTIIGVIHSNRV